MKIRMICLVAGLLCSTFSYAQQPEPAKGEWAAAGPRLNWLEERIPEINVTDVPFEGVVEYLSDFLKVNIVVRWEALSPMGVTRDKPMSLRLRNLKVSQALWLLLNEAGGPDVRLAYRATSNLLLVSTADDLGREMVVKAYDVTDLITPAPSFAGPTIDVSRAGGVGDRAVFESARGETGGGGEGRQGLAPELERLIAVVLATVEPDSWEGVGGKGTIAGFQRCIVVRNTIAVHQKLGGWLTERE